MISLYISIIGMESRDILFKYKYQTISVFHGLDMQIKSAQKVKLHF